jgi:hypothetical protein
MKRLVILVALVSWLGMTQAYTQGVMGGIKVDANLSNFILSDLHELLSELDGVESKFGVGLSVGGYTKVEISEHFALQPEILLHFKNSKMEVKALNSERDFQYFGVEMPLYAVGQKTFGNGKGFIGAGPYVGFGIDARYKAKGVSDVELYKEYNGQKSMMQRWDFGVGAMAGYEFGSRLQIIASWKIGVLNAMNANKDNDRMLNQTFSLGLGYRFN